jgi:hypothetical protein
MKKKKNIKNLKASRRTRPLGAGELHGQSRGRMKDCAHTLNVHAGIRDVFCKVAPSG